MKPITRAWIGTARLRRRVRRNGSRALRERHRDWVAEHAPGRSFADVGGLFEIAGDLALHAESCGAQPVTLADWGHAGFTDFPRKARERDSKVRFVQGDLEDPVAVERIGRHDIVWCVGLIYHSPNPVRLLMNLREITGELLYLGSHTIPEIPGIEHGCVYYPYISEPSRASYASAHERPEELWGIGTPFSETPMKGYGNFWWGITPSALEAMLQSAGFEVVERREHSLHPFLTELVARPIDRDPLLSPIDWSRRFGESMERGEGPLPYEDYYDRERVAGHDARGPVELDSELEDG